MKPIPYERSPIYARPLAVILDDLRQPIPDHLIQIRPIGGRRIRYVDWRDITRILDQCAPGWEGSVTQIHSTHDRVIVVYRLTIHAEEGYFSREGTGSEMLDAPATLDPSSSAEANALRRAAAKFGLALDL